MNFVIQTPRSFQRQFHALHFPLRVFKIIPLKKSSYQIDSDMPKHIHHNHQSLVVLLHKNDIVCCVFPMVFPSSLFLSHRWRCQGLRQGFSLGCHVERWRGGVVVVHSAEVTGPKSWDEKFSGNPYPTNALLESLRIFFSKKNRTRNSWGYFVKKNCFFFKEKFLKKLAVVKICHDMMGISTSLRFDVCW